MSIELVVVHPFADHATGDRIADPEQVKSVLESNPSAVIKVQVADQAQPDSAQEHS
jgi:hypothetical protein